MTRSLTILLISFTSFFTSKTLQSDVINQISASFKAGDVKEIAKYFAPSIEFIIVDDEDVYSKAQGEQILRDFLGKHPPQKASIIHKINTNPNYRFGVILLNTSKETFRVSVTMKKINNGFLITELRIEPAKD